MLTFVTSSTSSLLYCFGMSLHSHSFKMLKLFLPSCFALEIVQLFGSRLSMAWRCPCAVLVPLHVSPGGGWPAGQQHTVCRTGQCRTRAGRSGLRLRCTHVTQVTARSKPCVVHHRCYPVPPPSPSTILPARFVSLNIRVLTSPLRPPRSKFRHLVFEIHAVDCESLLLT